MTDQEFHLLVIRYLDDALDEAGLETLSKALLMDEARVVQFNDMRLHLAQLRECDEFATVAVQESPRPRRLGWLWVAAAVAVLAGVAVFGVKSDAPAPMAVFEDGENAVFASGLKPEDVIGNERLRLLSGTARLRLAQGALVELTGPAEVQIESPLALVLRHGQLYARVPTASAGFTVRAGELQVVDLGTVFTVKVDQVSGDAETRVLKGSVEAGYGVAPGRLLVAGEGVRLRDGVLTTLANPVDLEDESAQFANRIDRIPVVNHSFEQGPLADGPYHGALFRDLPSGWTHGIYKGGVWQLARADYAGVADCPLTDRGIPDFRFPMVPDGTRAAWLIAGAYRQTLAAPLRKLRTYRLTVAVGSHPGTGPGSNHPKYGDWGNDYLIELRAGGTVLASSSGQLPAGTPYRDVVIDYFCPLEHQAMGQPLEISLGGNHRIFYDNVRMRVE